MVAIIDARRYCPRRDRPPPPREVAGVAELAQPGYEQARSIVAAVAGDHEAAARVELVLPESGVCGGSGAFDDEPVEADGGCCGPSVIEPLVLRRQASR